MTTKSITNPLDRTQCPICGKSNNCGKEAGLEHCWCADLTFPRNPPQTVMSCFCRSCTDKMLEQEKATSNPAV
ncbi:MAG: cysteine-rich CWC family protein [SAR324 cluster bacterium]|nr:cysteine-rich CWC family protein [SAR324 cluster bacterium]